MDFISTRNKSIRTSAAGAILRGIAPDGGLFVPDALPAFSLVKSQIFSPLSFTCGLRPKGPVFRG